MSTVHKMCLYFGLVLIALANSKDIVSPAHLMHTFWRDIPATMIDPPAKSLWNGVLLAGRWKSLLDDYWDMKDQAKFQNSCPIRKLHMRVSGADPGFLERGLICICGIRFADFISLFLIIP